MKYFNLHEVFSPLGLDWKKKKKKWGDTTLIFVTFRMCIMNKLNLLWFADLKLFYFNQMLGNIELNYLTEVEVKSM